MWLKILDDGDDKEALEKLVDDAIERGDHTEATTLLRRLANTTVDKSEKARVALREAELLADGVGDVDMAIVRYESILSDLDPTCRPALQAIADLQEARENPAGAADALERELDSSADSQERGQVAGRLARLYETLDDSKNAIRALDIVRKADPEDFDALTRLCDLCEKSEQWDRVAELLAQRIEVEADDEDASAMTRRLAEILADKLDRGDEALAALTELADQGDPKIREAYIDLGDKLGWKGIVATKVVEWWFEARHGQERTTNLRGAFARFSEVGRDQDAVRVAVEIVRSKGADRELAERLEELAVKTGDQDALSIAHDLLAKGDAGERPSDRARSTGRSSREGRRSAQRGASARRGGAHERARRRCRAPPRAARRVGREAERRHRSLRTAGSSPVPEGAGRDRTRARSRAAAQVAGQRSQLDRARGFYELALSGSPADETLDVLSESAREGDEKFGGEKLRRALCAAMASGGQGARDGGRTRGALLRRAATISHRDLNDLEQSFTWLGDALVAHVEAVTLDALDALGREVGALRRSEASITRALAEVFDGPLVRQLLGRRAKLRREDLDDKSGAATDLKKLHDLSPTDQAVMDDLSGLLTELGDYRGMVQLYEDQILRGKDMSARAELARKVARMWEEQLQDPREAADAWRRVLRMKQGDAEATAGLERAKTNMLKKPDPDASDAYAPPKLQQSLPPAPPEPAQASATQESIPAVAPVSEAPPAAHLDPPTLPPTLDSALRLDESTGPATTDRASLFDEDEGEENGAPAKPARPLGLSFAQSHDEVTVSAPSELLDQVRARTNDHEYGQQDDFAKTGEGTAIDFHEAAAAHAKLAAATRVAPEEAEAAAAAGESDLGDEVIDADDLAEILDVQDDEEEGPATEPPPAAESSPSKRSPPPPIPRG